MVSLLGVDLQKDVDLNAAYNDVAGVTRLFNLNVLQHINDSFGGNFVLENFEHEASYNVAQGCVQMFLISQIDQEIELVGQSIAIGAGERIHTENSYKYTVGQVQDMAEAAGFRDTLIWTDSRAVRRLLSHYLSAIRLRVRSIISHGSFRGSPLSRRVSVN